MERLERNLAYIAIALMMLFAGLAVYAGIGLGIVLPTCQEHVAPFAEPKVVSKENNRFEVYYVARMWSFEPAELILPEKADVDLFVSSLDVNHGFDVLGTNLNLMAVPGTVNAAHHRFDRMGDYLIVCHEYCGLNHHNMIGKIRIVTQEEHRRWMAEQAGRILSEGEKLSAKFQCTECHTADGTEGLGPTFKGLYGKKQKLADGREILVDEAYLIESIKWPDKQIVMNYEPGSMPVAETPLSDEEIRHIVAYIEALQ